MSVPFSYTLNLHGLPTGTSVPLGLESVWPGPLQCPSFGFLTCKTGTVVPTLQRCEVVPEGVTACGTELMSAAPLTLRREPHGSLHVVL